MQNENSQRFDRRRRRKPEILIGFRVRASTLRNVGAEVESEGSVDMKGIHGKDGIVLLI